VDYGIIYFEENDNLKVVEEAAKIIQKELWICVKLKSENYDIQTLEVIISQLYCISTKICYSLNKPLMVINVLLENICKHQPHITFKECQVLIGPGKDRSNLSQINENRINKGLQQLLFYEIFVSETQYIDFKNISEKLIIEKYSEVVVGGTFDKLHAGHKILISISCLLTNKKIICGVADKALLKHKKYDKLIDDNYHRCQEVTKFINLFKSGLEVHVTPISDIYGPSVAEPGLQAIIVSHETKRGCDLINKKRIENKLNPLDIYIIETFSIIDESLQNGDLSSKLSSTKIRETISASSINKMI